MNEAGATQQIIDTINDADSILVTVSSNPSVDQLSAALGLTMFLNDISKHTTAVVSGKIPPAITFLDPEKTFESTVDSLRDFVIALDKEKADHLRYKVEGDVVKIFITPYKTVIGKEDLEFTQGDYNVEMVIALGVNDQDHLDKALEAHGRILHDASVATIGLEPSNLGSMDWVGDDASSLSEMLVELVEALRGDKRISEQVASALLTGIVASTDRFSNERTSSRTMTRAATLMAAGANQQLIASKLREGSKLPMAEDNVERVPRSEPPRQKKDKPPKEKSNNLTITHSSDEPSQSKKPAPSRSQDKPQPPATSPEEPKVPAPVVVHDDIEPPKDGEIYNPAVAFDKALKKSAQRQEQDQNDESEKLAAEVTAKAASSEEKFAAQLAEVTPVPAPAMPQLEFEEAPVPTPPPVPAPEPSVQPLTKATPELRQQTGMDEPSMGGTLNATTEQAAIDKRLQADQTKNTTILSHGGSYTGGNEPAFANAPFNGAGISSEPPSVDPFKTLSAVPEATPLETPPAASMQPSSELPPLPPQPTETLADIDRQNRQVSAANEVQAAFEASQAPAMPALPSFDAPTVPLPVPPGQPAMPPAPGNFEPLLPTPPPAPDFSALPPLPAFPDFAAPSHDQTGLAPDNLGSTLPPLPPQPMAPPQPADPKQFKIPGQV
jgi:hypothetical protein